MLAYLPLLTAFFNSAPAVNLATLRAAILMVAPVCGLRPLRAFLAETENVPKPISATRSPLRKDDVMLSTVVSMAVAACVLLMSQPAAILSMRSALFILSPERATSPAKFADRTHVLSLEIFQRPHLAPLCSQSQL